MKNRFKVIHTHKGHLLNLIENLKDDGFKEVPNVNWGDDDFLCIDLLYKEFIWCENGFAPFCSKKQLEQVSTDKTLSDLVKERE